ncbi:MAG: Spore photoproduct lyase, partial [uncultured Corynebacteriales bacterium]
ARRPPDLPGGRGGRPAPRQGGPGPVPGRRAGAGGQPLADPAAARRRGERGPLGPDQDRVARPRREEEPDRPAQRPLRRLHRPVHRERLRDGLRVLLRPAPQGLREPDHRLRQHRPDHRLPRPARRPAAAEGAEPGRPVGLGVRHRRELRLLRRRRGQRQRPGPGRALPRAAGGEGVVRHQARQPGPAGLRPGRPDPGPVLADAGPGGPAAGHPHRPDRRPDRRHRRLRRRRLRGARQLQPGRDVRGLAVRLGRAAVHTGRRHRRRGQAPAGRRGHLPDPQRRPARDQPRLAPEGRGPDLATRRAGAEALRHRRGQRALPRGVQAGVGAAADRTDRRAPAVLPDQVRVL